MTKKRKEQVSDENKKLSVSKAKKSTRRKTYGTGKSDLAESNNCSPEVTNTIARIIQECKENDQESNKTEHWAPDADISSTERDKETSYERKENNMDVLSQAQSMDGNISHTTESTEQNVGISSELLQLGDLLVGKVEDPQNQMNPHYDGLSERKDIKILNQEIRKLNCDNVSSGLVGSLEGTTSILERSLHLKPEESVFFLRHTPDKKDADGLKKKAFSLVPFKCPLIQETSINMLVEDKASGNIKDNQREELLGCSDVSMEQDKAIQDIKMSNTIREEIRNENGCRNDAGPVNCMTNKNESKSSAHQLPLVRDISTPGPRGQSKNLDACTMSRERSKEANQTATNLSEKTEEHYICNNTEICRPATSEKDTEPWSSTKPVLQNTSGQNTAQSNSYKEESITAEQNSILIKNVPGKNVPGTWLACSSLENEAGISGPKCELGIERSDLFFPQLDKNIKKSGQIVCRDESGLVEKARMEEILGKSNKVSTDQDVPNLLTQQQQKLNNSERVVPDIKQLQVIKFDSEPSKKVEVLSSTDIFKQNFSTETNIHMDGKEAMVVVHGESESKPVNVELGLSSKVLPVLITGDASEINAGSEAQRSPLVLDPGFVVSAPNDLDTGTQRCSPCTDPSSLYLEFLPDSQLQNLSETHSLEFPSHKRPVLDNLNFYSKIKSDPCAAEKQNEIETSPSVVLVNNPNPRDEVTKICDPCKQEDATGIICGLIKELSNLNRLIMNTHRELDSFKRSKLQRNRQLGKFISHNMNAMISTRFTAKKRKEM